VGMPLPTSVRSSTAFPRVCRRGTPRRAPRSPPHAEERESGHASPCFSQTARPWSIGNRDRDGLLPSLLPRHHEWRPAPPRTRRRERVVMPLPASLSVALHLQPQPTFARDSHRSSGEDPGQCRAAPRPPAKGTPRPRPPNRIPSYPCVHHFTPRTRSIATFRSSLTVFRSSPIHRPSVPASSTVRIPTADHVNAQYTPSSPHTQFLNQWRSLPITFIREERARPRPLSRRRRRHFGSRLYSQRSSLAPPA
jgi:hypothetical protein